MTVVAPARWQVMPPLSPQDQRRLRDSIELHGVLEPVILDDDGQVIDGHHRLLIAAELGRECPTRPRVEAERVLDPLDLAVELNLNRRHLTIEQKREVIKDVLKRHPERSDREVARQTEVAHTTVARIRDDLEAEGEIPRHRPANAPILGTRASARTERRSTDALDALPEAANHMGMVSVELTLRFPVPSTVERTRAGLPYARDSERREWWSGELWLTSPMPENVTELNAMLNDIGHRVGREMLSGERPLPSLARAS